MKIKEYYLLTKPGIIYGNTVTLAAGFLLASKTKIAVGELFATIVGVGLIIGSACVFNNYIDRSIDKKMLRTHKRALAINAIPVRSALSFAVIIGLFGIVVLGIYTNFKVVCIGLVGFILYVLVYAVAKRKSVHGTLVGSIPGAAPILAGYVAVSDRFNAESLIVFLILVLWQMPHFYSIAMYRHAEYRNADIPVLPVKKTMRRAQKEIIVYILLFTVACASLTLFNYTGYVYLIAIILLCSMWFLKAYEGYAKADSSEVWARGMFKFSLVVIMGLSCMLAVGGRLP